MGENFLKIFFFSKNSIVLLDGLSFQILVTIVSVSSQKLGYDSGNSIEIPS